MKPLQCLAWWVGLVMLIGCRSVPPSNQAETLGLDDALVRALTRQDYAEAERLLERCYPVSSSSVFTNAPAYWAISEGDVEALRLLIRFGLDVNYDWGEGGGNLLTNAVQFGHLEQVQTLVQSVALLTRDPKYGRSPLYAAVIYDHKAIETYLRDKGAQFNQWDIEAFRIAEPLGAGDAGKRSR